MRPRTKRKNRSFDGFEISTPPGKSIFQLFNGVSGMLRGNDILEKWSVEVRYSPNGNIIFFLPQTAKLSLTHLHLPQQKMSSIGSEDESLEAPQDTPEANAWKTTL